jgi:hypothetical protein
VTVVEAEAFARMHNLETSAKSVDNRREAFVAIATAIMSRGLKGVKPPSKTPLDSPESLGQKPCCSKAVWNDLNVNVNVSEKKIKGQKWIQPDAFVLPIFVISSASRMS